MKRHAIGIDTLDLELDLDIHPDLSFSWKDEDEYQKSITSGLLLPDWTQGVDVETPKILDKLENRQYPFDGTWLNWMPDPNWSPPELPANWDKI